MKKNTKVILWVAALAVAAYLGYRWWKGRQGGSADSPTGSLGANLNSVAPELVGGSSGPSVGPAVSMPLTIQLTQPAVSTQPPEDNDSDEDMDGDKHHGHHPIHRQRHLAVDPGGPMDPFADTGGSATDANPGGPGVFAGGDMNGGGDTGEPG